ncbi:MAG: HK97 gp10 family phage protein [Prevotella sp.]|nr:HK97 gp10 family phage protein [Prevotella sp.]
MPIKRMSPRNALGQYLERKVSDLRRVLLNNLIYVGEEAVKEARQRGRYKDQTGNLRSSIGYCILDDGVPVTFGGFKVVKDGRQGAQQGRKFLDSLISEHSTGLVLIVVAGMEYAQYVEAMNLNVLDSAEQLAERLVPQMIKSLKI